MPIKFNITQKYFKSKIQGTRPYLFKNALKAHPINWKLVNQLISRHDHTSSNFKILKNGLILKYDYLEQYQEVFTTKYRANKAKLYELMKSGASLALNKKSKAALRQMRYEPRLHTSPAGKPLSADMQHLAASRRSEIIGIPMMSLRCN